MPRVVVIGGGLAGMVAALELGQKGVQVHLLEASPSRLGGKAGADRFPGDPPRCQDHGYHIFPAWYVNTRRLLKEIGADRYLIDLHKVHYLKIEDDGKLRWCTFHEPTPGNAIKNIRSGLKPWHVSTLAFYAGLDLATESLSESAFLDRTSANGYLRSQWYATEETAVTNHQFILQASSIASYQLAAMTASRVIASYLASPKPFQSVLDRDMQRGFIDPLEQALQKAGVVIELGKRVRTLTVEGCRIAGLVFQDGTKFAARDDDCYLLATPFEVTYNLVDAKIVAVEEELERTTTNTDRLLDEKRLSDLVHLVRAPMAAFHVYCRSRMKGIPREHVILHGSRYELSFIDVSTIWSGHQGGSVLSGIASAYAPLGGLRPDLARAELVRELLRYLPGLDREIVHVEVAPHLDAQLFLNTVGSYPYRPCTKTRLENLYIASDYCRTKVELTTMESAVESGLCTAQALLRTVFKIQNTKAPLAIPKLPRGLMRLLFYVLTPGIAVVWAISRLAVWMDSRAKPRPDVIGAEDHPQNQ